MGSRRRNGLLDTEKLLWLLRASDMGEFRRNFQASLAEAIINGELKRQAQWIESIAVGDRAWVEEIERRIRGRQEMSVEEVGAGWVLKEEYGSVFALKKRAISLFESSNLV